MKDRRVWPAWRHPWSVPHWSLIGVFVVLAVVNAGVAVAESALWQGITAAACALVAVLLVCSCRQTRAGGADH